MGRKLTAVQKALKRGMEVAPEEVGTFPWTPEDVMVAEAMISGCKTVNEIAEEVGIKPELLRHRLLDPVRCAWLSTKIEGAVQSRLGRVIASVYNRAVTNGDVRAAEFLMKHYGKMRPEEKHHLHAHATLDFSQLATEELEKLRNDYLRKLGMNLPAQDAEFTVEGRNGS